MNKIIDFKNSNSFKKKQEETGIPVYSQRIPAGIPSYATEEHIEKVIEINLIKLDSLKGKKPEHLGIFTIYGNSMEPILFDKQKVIVDRRLATCLSLPDLIGKIIVANLDNQLTIKKLNADKKYFYLIPENEDYEILKIKRNDESFQIVGVMVDVLKGNY